MRALIGLGNPGEQYKDTRHNLGFVAIDVVAKKLDITIWKKDQNCLVAEYRTEAGEKVFLVKPQSFMNTSGQPIRQFLDYYNIVTSDVAIVADDVYVKPGSARIRQSGGDGGHNGWKSVIAHLDPDTFWRVKIGCGLYEQHPEKRTSHPPLDQYVLERQAKHDEKTTQELIDKIVPNLVEWLESGQGLSDQTVHI